MRSSGLTLVALMALQTVHLTSYQGTMTSTECGEGEALGLASTIVVALLDQSIGLHGKSQLSCLHCSSDLYVLSSSCQLSFGKNHHEPDQVSCSEILVSVGRETSIRVVTRDGLPSSKLKFQFFTALYCGAFS